MAKSKIETLWLMAIKKKNCKPDKPNFDQIYYLDYFFFNFPYRELELECY